MKVINVQAAKTHLSRILEDVASGKEVVLAKSGKPIARLVPYTHSKAQRMGGQLKGHIWEASDCWDKADDPLGTSAAGPLYSNAPADIPERKVAEGSP